MKIIDVQGIGPAYAEKLETAGIRTTGKLLKKGATEEGRQKIESMTGIGHNLILEWVNMVDLYRIRGVGSQYSELLEKAGVDTVVELSNRIPEHLHAKMLEENKNANLVNKMPGIDQVTKWIQQAKQLPRVISY